MFPFHITTHETTTQYLRDYPHATTTQDAPLKLVAKKYTPVDNPNPQPGDVTLIGFHGAGIPKELYEPLWEETLEKCKNEGIKIRAIWIADAANTGASGVVNEGMLGNDPSWTDHSRDMLHMINTFRDDMPQPLVGVGHSLGTTQLLFLSLIHPRLFTSLILIEPFFAPTLDANGSALLVTMALKKKDVWPSRQIAAEKIRRIFPHWDDRVFSRWVDVGYRDLPTVLHPDVEKEVRGEEGKPVTLTTSKHQEVLMYTRPNLERHQELGLEEADTDTDTDTNAQGGKEGKPPHDPLFYPDVLGKLPPTFKFYRYESMLAWRLLPHIRPQVLYIGGGKGTMEKSGSLRAGAERTGTKWSGSGGMARGRVKHVTVQGGGHDVSLQRGKIGDVAGEMGSWIKGVVGRWKGDEERVREGWEGLSAREKTVFRDEWREALEEGTKGKAKL